MYYLLVHSLDFSSFGSNDGLLLDSTLKLYHQAKHDTTKLRLIDDLINNISHDYFWSDYNELNMNSAEKLLANKSLSKQVKLFYQKIIADGFNNMGYLAEKKGDSEKAHYFYYQSIEKSKKCNNLKGRARAYSNLGV